MGAWRRPSQVGQPQEGQGTIGTGPLPRTQAVWLDRHTEDKIKQSNEAVPVVRRSGRAPMTIDITETGIYNISCLDFIPKLPDNSIDCVVTDPPYGVDFHSRSAVTAEGKKWVKKVANDNNLEGALALFAEVMSALESKVADQCDVYVFTRWDIVGAWIDSIAYDVPWLKYKMLLVWDKGSPGMGDIDSNWGCGHELILYCKKGLRDVAYRRSGIIAVDRMSPKKAIHPTEKPVPLLEKFVEMSTAPGDVVFDPFSGSGSTAVACNNLGRIGIGTELDTDHYRRSLQRLSQGALF